MLIGQFNDSYPPITDGVAAVTRNYAHWITKNAERGSASLVVTPNAPGYSDVDEIFEVVRYFSLPFFLRSPYRIGLPGLDLPLHRKLSDVPFDLVHAQCPFSSGHLALSLAKRRNIPLVASFHTKYRDDFLPIVHSAHVADAMIRHLMRIYEQADSVWTVNEASVETLREYGFKGPVTVIQNGSDLEPADPAHRRSEASDRVSHELGIDSQEKVFLFIGQHVWQKNLRLLIDSLAEVKKAMVRMDGSMQVSSRPTFRMYFVGSGSAEREMQEKIDALGLAPEVRLLGVIRDRVFVRGLFERSDLFLFPSTYDTSALVLRESASALCPTVFIEGSTVAEGIVDGKNGYLSKETPEDFAATILRAVSDPSALRATGMRAQQDFHRTWSTVATDVLSRYEEIVRNHDPSHR